MRTPPAKNRGRDASEGDASSVVSFGGGPKAAKPRVKFAWMGGSKIDEDNFLTMQQEYLQMKDQERESEQKIKKLTAQLARTEEAAKRSLLQSDASARGGVAQRLLDAERLNQKLTSDNCELEHKLEKERKRSSELKITAEKSKRKLDSVMKEQRQLIRKVGELEGKKNRLRRSNDDFLSQEAGQRFAKQQEELVMLREENERLNAESENRGHGQWEHKARTLERKVRDLENQLSRARNFSPSRHTQSAKAPISESDWLLEDFTTQGQAFLMDPTSRQIFHYPSQGEFPKPIGDVDEKGVVCMADCDWVVSMISALDGVLKAQQRNLREGFKKLGSEGGRALARGKLEDLLELLFADQSKWLVGFFLGALESSKSEEDILFEELRMLMEASRNAGRAVKEQDWLLFREALKRVKRVIENSQDRARKLFDEKSGGPDDPLSQVEVFSVLNHMIQDSTPQEQAFLRVSLRKWDTAGNGLTFSQLKQSLEIGQVRRKPIDGGPPSPTFSPEGGSRRFSGVEKLSAFNADERSYEHFRSQQGGGGRLDVMALEKEIEESRKREETLRAQNSVLRRDLSDMEARSRELEDVALLKEVGSQEGNLDSQIKAAWQACNTFKKRYIECRTALDTIKSNHEHTLQQLSDTHKNLQEKNTKCYKLESEATKLRVEVQHARDLEAMLISEREDRVKVEKDLLDAQQKAFAAPGGALKEVSNLRREIMDLQRVKGLAERKEAEVRRELLSLRQSVNGVSAADYHRLEREVKEAKQQNTQLQIELHAMGDKLDVYRRTQGSGPAIDVLKTNPGPGVSVSRTPDEDKKEEELRIELRQLREVYIRDKEETDKIRALLDRECEISLEARAALETAEQALENAKRDLGEEVAKLRRELERRDEKIHQLESQLKGTITGLGKALVRSSAANKNSLAERSMGMEALGDDENVFELQILEAKLEEGHVGVDPSTFVSVDFFEHETQATSVATGTSPNFDATIKYVVASDAFFVKYLDTSTLVLELNQARGWDYDTIAKGRMPLKRVIEEADVGAGIGDRLSFHHVELVGATGDVLGKLRFGFRLYRPLHAAIGAYRSQQKAIDAPSFAGEINSAQLSHIRVVVHCCEALRPSVPPAASRPYVSYNVPCSTSHRNYDTRFSSGADPVFDDEAIFEIVRSSEKDSTLKTDPLELVVYDESDMEGSEGGILGITKVPLDLLLEGLPLEEKRFPLTHPVSKKAAGFIVVTVNWHQPLRLPTVQGGGVNQGAIQGDSLSKSPIAAHWPGTDRESPDSDPLILPQPPTSDPMGDVTAQPEEIEDELIPVQSISPDIARPRYQHTGSNQPQHIPLDESFDDGVKAVALPLSSNRNRWPDPHDYLIVHVMSVTLDPIALSCPEVQSIIVVQSFLDELCPVEVQSSRAIAKSRGPLQVDHAVGYDLKECGTVVRGMIENGECRLYLGVVSQIEETPVTGTVASRVSTVSKGAVKYLDIGMCDIDLLRLMESGADLERATLRIPSSDKYKALTGAEYLGDMKVTIRASEGLSFVS
ncbi:hypothetical protein BSKO_13531 [Bryopsis sp. KO-2023]|nr:hypothetical protein BSKO_13531 [Bryopsis sp. KO-2023]